LKKLEHFKFLNRLTEFKRHNKDPLREKHDTGTAIREGKKNALPRLMAFLSILLGENRIALAVAPALAGDALHNQLPLLVALLAQRAQPQRVALTARGVVLKPAAVGTGTVGAAVLAQAAPPE
jgi:hypothetical protein